MRKISGRKLIIGAALAASALTAAVPAAAQYYPQAQQHYGYSQPYGYNQGYTQNNYGQARMLLARVDRIRQQIRLLDRRGALSNQEAYRLDREAQILRNRVRQLSYNGIDPRERFAVERRIEAIERRVVYNAADRNDRYNRAYGIDNRWQSGDNRWHDRDDGDNGRWDHRYDRDDD